MSYNHPKATDNLQPRLTAQQDIANNTPSEVIQKQEYIYSRNNNITNAIFTAGAYLMLEQDEKKRSSIRTYRQTNKGVVIEVEQPQELEAYPSIKVLTAQVKQTLSILHTIATTRLGHITKSNSPQKEAENRKCEIPLSELMQEHRVKDAKEYKQNLIKALDILDSFKITGAVELGGEIIKLVKAPIIHDLLIDVDINGNPNKNVITFYWGDIYFHAFVKSYLTIYASEVNTLSPNQNALAIDVGREFFTQKRRNKDIESTTLNLETIYDDCDALPRLPYVEPKHFYSRYIDPICNAMDEIFIPTDWDFLDSKTQTVKDIKELKHDNPPKSKGIKGMKASLKKTSIIVYWKNFPEEKLKSLYKSIEKRKATAEKAYDLAMKKATKKLTQEMEIMLEKNKTELLNIGIEELNKQPNN